MSTTVPPVTSEKTFSKFTKEQGANYAQHRSGYHPYVYQTLLDHHTSTGGQLTTLLDVGCGPGIATRGLSPHFVHAIGIDPSEGMINNARSLGGSSTSAPIRFEISTAEDLGSALEPPIADESIDLITAATAAHWFDMSRFWPAAARVLKPGGSVALWTMGPVGISPETPNAAGIEASMEVLRERELAPFQERGNLLAHNLYVDLPLPWTLELPETRLDEGTFFRKEWKADGKEDFLEAGKVDIDLDKMEKMLSTMSPVQRWRDANPEKVGTEEDVVISMRKEIETLLWAAGVEKGKETIKGNPTGVLLIVKKKA